MRLKKDGARKNDCEAATRLLEDVRREHPHLKLVEDGLAGPHLLKGLDLRFILGAKPGDHKFLFEWVNSAPSVEHQERMRTIYGTNSGTGERYALSKSIFSNTGRNDGKKQRWVTDLPINEENAMQLMRAGRARWKKRNFQHPPRLLL